jgi:superfamily II DNA/RNA helicase
MNENTIESLPIKTWDDLNIRTDLLRGIYSYGFETPSDIQKNSIKPFIDGKDIIAQAQSGTGKTGAFTIGTLQAIELTGDTQAIILAPTHELVKQISDVFKALGSSMQNLFVKTVIGGTSIGDDIASFRSLTPHIVVGSTGRVLDLIRRGCISTRHIKIMVMDEADELLSFGFKNDVYNIFQHLNDNVQIALFSATLPSDVLKIAEKFMRTPTRIILQPDKMSVEGIDQFFIALNDDKDKYDMMKKLFSTLVISQCIVYVNSIQRVIELHSSLSNDGYAVYTSELLTESQRNEGWC